MSDVDAFLDEQLASVKADSGPKRRGLDTGNGVERETDKNGVGTENGKHSAEGDEESGGQANDQEGSSSGGDGSSGESSSDDSEEGEGEGGGDGEDEEEEGVDEEENGAEGDEEDEENDGGEGEGDQVQEEQEVEEERKRGRDRSRRKRSRSRERGERDGEKRSRRSHSEDRGRDRHGDRDRGRKERHRDRDDRDRRSRRSRSRDRDRDRDSGRSRRDRHFAEREDKDERDGESSKDKDSPKDKDKDKDRSRDKDEKERSRNRDKDKSRSRSRSRERDRERRHRDRRTRRNDRDRDREDRRDNHRDDRRDSHRDDRRDGHRDDRRDGHREDRRDGHRDRDRDRDRYSRRDRDRDRDRDDRRDRDSDRRSRRPSHSRSRSRSPRRSEKTKEEREEAAKRAAIDELTRDQRTVFVNQLTMKVTEDDLAKYFGLLGEVNNVIMLRDKFTNRHKGFAYVEMKSLESVPVVLQLNNRVPDFQKFPVMVKASEAEKNYLAKQEERLKNPNKQKVILGNAAALAGLKLHIGNLHQNITEDDLGEICRSFGEVTQLILHRDEAGESKRFAFVTYADKESATACLEKLDGLEVAGKALAVSYCKAEQPSSDATGNWKLDDDEGAGGMKMDSTNRASLMAKLGGANVASAAGNSTTVAVASVAAAAAAASMGLPGIPGIPGIGTMPPGAVGTTGLPGMPGLPGVGGMGMMPGVGGVAAQSPSAAANAALEAALSGTAFGTSSGATPGVGGGLPPMVAATGQMKSQTGLHPALAASLPGMPTRTTPAAPIPAPAPAAKPPVLGTPTFCLLVKNMFDPTTETEEGWELDIKEEMEEECSKHGAVMHSYVETRQPGGLVYVMFSTTGAAVASAEMLNGRWFAGRSVTVEYLAPQVYTAKFPEATKAAQTALATAANA